MEYVVRDRSLLLPAYKRFVVEPALPAIPRRLHPNVITHVGHLVNALGAAVLVATHATRGWPLVFAMIALQIYNFCDNADGGHARRTQQCSPLGELLDHGLDLLNVTYIAIVSALAIGASPVWTTAIAVVLPAACALTYWEQAETGLFSLGSLNQIESVMLLSAVLVVSAIFGVDVWQRLALGPISLRVVICAFVTGVALVGIVRNFVRVVRKRTWEAFASSLPLVAFANACFVGVVSGALSAPASIAAASAASIFFGVRSLARRTEGKRPAREPGLLVGALVALAYVLVRPGGETFAAMAAVAFFGAYGVANARAAYGAVTRASPTENES